LDQAAPQKVAEQSMVTAMLGRAKAILNPAAAQKAMVDAILELRAVVKEGTPDQIAAAIETFKAKALAGDLDRRELAGEVADAEEMLATLAYTDRLGRGEGVESVATRSDGASSYFRRRASRAMARDDDYGGLDICDKGLFFDGEKPLVIVWKNVLTIETTGHSLIVHRTRGGTPYDFGVGSERAARLAQLVATTVWKHQTTADTTPSARRTRKRSQAVASADSTSNEINLPSLDLGSPSDKFDFNIVGESQYQGRLRNVSESTGRTFRAVLMPEPSNAFDPNAIRVAAEGGDTVGYLSREDALRYAPVFALLRRHNHMGICRARLTGGEGAKRSFGVLLNLREADQLLVDLRNSLEPGAVVDPSVKPF
jgi:HIRAN domain